jgi:ATP synthase protein I
MGRVDGDDEGGPRGPGQGGTGGRDTNSGDDTTGMSPFARAMVEAGPYLAIGWVFAVSVGVFALLGWWLDGWLGTGRLCLIGGSLFGIAIGFVNFFKVVLASGKRRP